MCFSRTFSCFFLLLIIFFVLFVSFYSCGTSGGVVINFGKIEVVNRLKEELVYETIKNYTVYHERASSYKIRLCLRVAAPCSEITDIYGLAWRDRSY